MFLKTCYLLPPDCELSSINVCLPRSVKSIVVTMHQKWICHFTWHLPPLLTFVPVFYSPLWEIQSQTSSILLFSRIWCCWWKLETKCWESTFLAAWGAKQNVPSRLSDRAFSKNIWSKLPTKLKVRKTISLTKATQIQNVQSTSIRICWRLSSLTHVLLLP